MTFESAPLLQLKLQFQTKTIGGIIMSGSRNAGAIKTGFRKRLIEILLNEVILLCVGKKDLAEQVYQLKPADNADVELAVSVIDDLISDGTIKFLADDDFEHVKLTPSARMYYKLTSKRKEDTDTDGFINY